MHASELFAKTTDDVIDADTQSTVLNECQYPIYRLATIHLPVLMAYSISKSMIESVLNTPVKLEVNVATEFLPLDTRPTPMQGYDQYTREEQIRSDGHRRAGRN